MRPYTMRMKPPIDPMIGSSVAVVEESKNPKFPKGAIIVILAVVEESKNPKFPK